MPLSRFETFDLASVPLVTVLTGISVPPRILSPQFGISTSTTYYSAHSSYKASLQVVTVIQALKHYSNNKYFKALMENLWQIITF